MPVKSKKQLKYMEMIANDSAKMKGSVGPSKKVAKEMLDKTPDKKKKSLMRGK